jgi:hypothetical protein
MNSERRDDSRNCFAKKWDPAFLTNRTFGGEPETHAELGRRLDQDGDGLTIFLQDSESLVPSCITEEVEEFCVGSSLELNTPSAVQRRTVWFDERLSKSTSDGHANRPNRLTAVELYELLKASVRGKPLMPFFT